jgi:hypothetical protein
LQYPIRSLNRAVPRIANINQIKHTTTRTLKIDPTDYNKAFTTIFILMLCETNLNGRNVLSSLSIFTAAKSIDETDISIKLLTTIKLSSIFQKSLRYVSSSTINPYVITFRDNSIVKQMLNRISILFDTSSNN